MKRIFGIVCMCALLIGTGTRAYAALPGTTCSTAIPLGANFEDTITSAKTVWYSAWTFDLPLTVYFAPANGTSDQAPDVEMDFSCTSGYYEDSILCSLFCRNASSGVMMDMPHKPALQTDYLPDGRFVYYLSMGKRYRDILLQVGISYNVQVYVKVVYRSAGKISIAPDNTFSNCMDGHKFMQLGDTVNVQVRNKDRHVIVPYIQWQEDSIRYIWNGTQPVMVAIGYTCSYDPTDYMDGTILSRTTLQPGDTMKMTSDRLKYYVREAESEAGMFFAKFYTDGTGVMKIERVPQAPPRGGATLLRYDKTTPVPADTNALFAIPYTWTKATKFTTPTQYVFKMYIGTDPSFMLKDAIASYTFYRSESGHWLGLLDEEMEELWTHTSEQYLYVRFECNEKTTVTPTEWITSDCVKNSILLKKDTTFSIESNSTKRYRLYYNDWRGGDMTVYWNQNQECRMLLLEDCDVSTTNPTSSKIVYYAGLADKETVTIPAVDIEGWTRGVDDEGFVYFRFFTTRSGGGQITLTSAAPEDADPEPEPLKTATISVTCAGVPTASGQSFSIQVSKEQDLTLDKTNTWHQSPTDEPHMVTLPSGMHELKGEAETIHIVVP